MNDFRDIDNVMKKDSWYRIEKYHLVLVPVAVAVAVAVPVPVAVPVAVAVAVAVPVCRQPEAGVASAVRSFTFGWGGAVCLGSGLGGRRKMGGVRGAAAVAAAAAALAQKPTRPARDSLVYAALMARPRLALVAPARFTPLARADVCSIDTLLVDLACSLRADREALAGSQEALLAATPPHHSARMAERCQFAPSSPRNALPRAPAASAPPPGAPAASAPPPGATAAPATATAASRTSSACSCSTCHLYNIQTLKSILLLWSKRAAKRAVKV
jgi:hypothetical protein